MPRKFNHYQEQEIGILEMRSYEMTLREIGEKLGFTYKKVLGFLIRYNQKQKKLSAGILPKHKGRPKKGEVREPSIAEYKYEIERLKMENKLLRDFLQSTGSEG